jgi:hypothetical protein
METSREIELDWAKMRVREDGVLHVVLTEDIDLTLKGCKAMNAAVQELADGPSPILSDIRRMRSTSMLQMRYAAEPEVIAVTRKLAVLVGSPVSRMLGSALVAVAKPPYPIRLFTDERAATRWLLEDSGGSP